MASDLTQPEHSQPRATRSSDRRGSTRSLNKTASSVAFHTAPDNGVYAEGVPAEPDIAQQVHCVGFKVLLFRKDMTAEEKAEARRISERLHTLRSWMHWLMNSAADAWRYADKRPSQRDPNKEVRDRLEVTQAVKDACERQRVYAGEMLDKVETGIEKIRVKLGRAKARNRVQEIKDLEKELATELRRVERFRDARTLILPSTMRDVIVRRTEASFKRWAKNKGAMAYPSFRYGQPIHFRDGDWVIDIGARRGVYNLTIPVGGEGRSIERITLAIVPSSGSDHAFAKMMIDGRAKLCNASVTWSQKKRTWFAKLTIKYDKLAPEHIVEGGCCALRLGVHNAVVMAFDTGDVEVIRGIDLVRYKERIGARRNEIRNHLRSLEAGTGARGRGKRRRFKALSALSERERNHVDTTIGRWANLVLRFMKKRGASTIHVALGASSMVDTASGIKGTEESDQGEEDSDESQTGDSENKKGSEIVQAYLAKFPRLKLRDAIKRVVEADGRTFNETPTHLDARTCPACEHVHDERPKGDTFHCEICGASVEADHVLAWNLINDVVGSKVPFRERLKKRADLIKQLKGELSDGSSGS